MIEQSILKQLKGGGGGVSEGVGKGKFYIGEGRYTDDLVASQTVPIKSPFAIKLILYPWVTSEFFLLLIRETVDLNWSFLTLLCGGGLAHRFDSVPYGY